MGVSVLVDKSLINREKRRQEPDIEKKKQDRNFMGVSVQVHASAEALELTYIISISAIM